MADDWWAAATAAASAAASGAQSLLNSAGMAPVSAPPEPDSARRRPVTQTVPSADPLLAALSRPSPRALTPAIVGLHPRAARAAGSLPVPRQQRAAVPHADALGGVDLHELVENATGHARPPGMADAAAARALLASVRQRATRVDVVLRALVAGSDGLADAPYNASVLALVHALLGAGSHALPAAAAGSFAAATAGGATRAPPALRVVADAHRAARRARGASPADVLGTAALRDAVALEPPPPSEDSTATSSSRAAATCRGVEAYAVLLARRLTFAAAFPETEANFSLDRCYRRLGIENRAESARTGVNNARQSRLRSPETRDQVVNLVSVGVRAAELLARARVSREIVAGVFAECTHAYVFSEYLRAKCGVGSPPVEEQLALRELAATLVPECRKEDDTGALAKFTGMDESVACEIMVTPSESARAVRIESRHRRDVVCQFTSFAGLHEALDPFSRSGNSRSVAQKGA